MTSLMRDVPGPSAEDVSPGPTFLALHQPVALQFEKDRLQELLRKSLPLSEFRRLNGPAPGLVGENAAALSGHTSTSL